MTNLNFAFWNILEHFFLNIFDLRQIGRAGHIHNTPLIMFLSQNSFLLPRGPLVHQAPSVPIREHFLLLEFLAVSSLEKSDPLLNRVCCVGLGNCHVLLRLSSITGLEGLRTLFKETT